MSVHTTMTAEEVLNSVHLEVRRCQRAVDRGSPKEFWVKRLDRAATDLEEAVTVLRLTIDSLRTERP